jgi:hypothetical protein
MLFGVLKWKVNVLGFSTVAWMFPLSTAYKKRTGDQETITDWHNVTVYASPSAKFLDALIQKG